MQVNIVNNTNNKKATIEIKKVILKEPPYTVIDSTKYETLPDDLLLANENRLSNDSLKVCGLCGLVDMIIVTYSANSTWANIHEEALNFARRNGEFRDPKGIQGIGLSYDPVYRAHTSGVVDPSAGTPYECLPDKAMLFISMLKRAEGWYPVMVGLEICDSCGKTESQEVKIKKCSMCMKAKYCSKECQIADWQEHKVKCSKRIKQSL